MPIRLKRSVPARGLLVVLISSLVFVVTSFSDESAQALETPVVPPPSCFKNLYTGATDCKQVSPDGTYGTGGISASVSGAMSNGQSFSVTLNPSVGPCTSQEQSGCYSEIGHFGQSGVSWYMQYTSHTSQNRLAERVTGSISSEPGSYQIRPQGDAGCRADFNQTYGDGYHFAERAAAVLTCTYDFDYTKSYQDDTLVPIDRLKGPTWQEVSGSIWVCDQPGGRSCPGHTESVVALIRLVGDLAPGPTASCQNGTQSGPGGSSMTFNGKASTTLLDVARSWTVQPASATATVSHSSYFPRESRVDVVAHEPGEVRATYRVESWQGISSATCTATVADVPDLPPPPPTCSGTGEPQASASRARVGKTIRLTPGSWATGAQVTFKWKAGTKVVGRQADFKPTKGIVGKKLKATLTATRPGCEAEREVLSFGRVRPRNA